MPWGLDRATSDSAGAPVCTMVAKGSAMVNAAKGDRVLENAPSRPPGPGRGGISSGGAGG
jgi:hypothetical protein